MALSPDFPRDPYVPIDPSLRWFPGEGEATPSERAMLVPPLVAGIREKLHDWRLSGYRGASDTSIALLKWWFETRHPVKDRDGVERDFRWYFAQREAVETVIWLYEVEEARDPASLIEFDATGLLTEGHFSERWTRYVAKMATGAGKTKVLSLLIAWSYFHKRYEAGSPLSTNFLLIAPNIIVLDRLRSDFEGLRIFTSDPVLPPDGLAGRAWRADFSMMLHVQDDLGVVGPEGNLFLTNVQRIYNEAAPVDPDDLKARFLGQAPVSKTSQRLVDLGTVVRQVRDLVILNDEAHHIHEPKLAWFKAIEDINNRMKLKYGHGISLQMDVTATPKNEKGGIFPQTVSSYPLVEAIRQGVVKTPVLPDPASRERLQEQAADSFAETYADHLRLGYLEWAKRREEVEKRGRKPVMFIMVDDTKNCDEVADYVAREFPELGAPLVIHTNREGIIAESEAGKNRTVLEHLRQQSREIDDAANPYKCVVSVLMLREGWDVQSVISIVGLRAFSAESKILPEQTLGRGLRRMFRGEDFTEYVSVVGTPGFLDFVETIRNEGVELETVPMSLDSSPRKPLLIELERGAAKDLGALDISWPRLQQRIERVSKDLNLIDVDTMEAGGIALREFTAEEQREIVFRDLDTDDVVWKTDLGQDVPLTQQAVIAYLTTDIMNRLRLVGGQDALYGKVKSFIAGRLFTDPVDLDDPNVLRNLSETPARATLIDRFASAINDLTISDSGSTRLVTMAKLTQARPILVDEQPFILSNKTVFNRVVGDSGLELTFAQFLDRADDVTAFAKNSKNFGFAIEYINVNGEIDYYYPDFITRTQDDTIWVIETKGEERANDHRKWNRLVDWCSDATAHDPEGRLFRPLYVTGDRLEQASPRSFAELVRVCATDRPQFAVS